MIQVEIFNSLFEDKLKDKLNSFLSDLRSDIKVIDIKYNIYVVQATTKYSAMIIYEK